MAIGAHPDDLEIGAFGSLAKWRNESEIHVVIATDGSYRNSDLKSKRAEEAMKSASLIDASVHFLEFPDGKLEHSEIFKDVLKAIVKDINPTKVIVNAPDDMHPDHRVLSTTTVAVTRNIPEIWFYETPSTLELRPNIFVDVTNFISIKIQAIQQHKTQLQKFYMQEESIYGNAQFRARHFRKQRCYAEAFELFKVCM